MQKIIIKNFGAIKEAEIDIKQVLILIGEQASGKSTIAKLIYFFQGLPNSVLEGIKVNGETDTYITGTNRDFEIYALNKIKANTSIVFHYSNDIFITIKGISNKNFLVEFNDSIKTLIKKAKEKYNLDKEQAPKIDKDFQNKETSLQESFINYSNQFFNKLYSNLFKDILDIFKTSANDSHFLVASRGGTIGSDLFEKYQFAAYSEKQNTGDEKLLFDFLVSSSRTKDYFKNRGGTFENLLTETEKNDSTLKAEKIIEKILKGNYVVSNSGEFIRLHNGEFIPLNQTSSGQQESIRILQNLFLVIANKKPALRVVEEPEAHLFPIAQKQMVELLALMVNQNEGNTLIITTHSPYILTSFNNLLCAYQVVKKHPDTEAEVARIVDKEFRLNSKDFSAYTLVSDIDTGDYISQNILSEQGLIKADYLDEVSEILGSEFNKLLSINSKKFVRR